jgi:hypothetical protein
MSRGAMDLAPLLCFIRAKEMPLLFLVGGLIIMIPVISTVFMVSPIGHVDLPIVLLLLRGSFTMRLKKSSPGLGSLNACVRDCEQIGHRLGFLHDNLLHGLNVANNVTEGNDDLYILDVRDNIFDIAATFHVVPETLIMLLPNGLESLSSR